MSNDTELERFMKVIEESVGRRLDNIDYRENFPSTNQYKNRLAYVEVIRDREQLPKHYWYLSKLYLDFGQHPRDKFINPFSIRPYCTWHILKNAKSLCSYVGLHDTDGFLKTNLALIQNHVITQAFFIPDKFNLFFEFENSFWLALFPNNLGFNIGVRSGFWYVHNKQVGFQYIPMSY